MTRNGRVVFSPMNEAVFGRPAAEAVAEQAERLGAARVLVMASATLARNTPHVARIRHALGPRFEALYQGMPAHSPRGAVLDDTRIACQAAADLIVTAPIATGVPMGASHGIGYVPGAAFDIPHGHTSCIMLPAVMRWNRPANAVRQAMVAAAMGQPGGDAADALDVLIAGLGMPRSLGAVGIGRDAFPNIAERAMVAPWVRPNPRRIKGPAQVTEILELAA